MSDTGRPHVDGVWPREIVSCEYRLGVHTSVVRKLGPNDEGVIELRAVVGLFSGFDRLVEGLQVEPGDKHWHG